MYKIKTIAIGAVLAIVSGPAIAALPSTDWVNEQLGSKVDVSQGANKAGYFLQVNDDGEVEPTPVSELSDEILGELGGRPYEVVLTGPSGDIDTGPLNNEYIQDGTITASKINSRTRFALKNINLPTPPADCQNGTKTCMLMYSGGYFAWDVVDRDTNDPTDVMPTEGRVQQSAYVNIDTGRL